ncbi:MAG: FIST C-terminal domain-containing protein [Clostridiales Family XIII bacterium]|jgi:hypothetical protein|nr:FIST C-terminal domain-containing protein [Clostridiales Family XIII bacterium]
MIKLITAQTSEIDDPELAAEEIMSQIDTEHDLLKNSVGLISCHYEYIEQSVTASLSGMLPFDVIGCTTLGSATNGGYGLEQLSLTILTSDDLIFATALSEEISKTNIEGAVSRVYDDARRKLPGDPSFIIPLVPIMHDVSGEIVFKKLNESGGGVPIFGTLSNDPSIGYEHSRTFRNEDSHRFKVALLLIYGRVDSVRFYTAAISDKNIQKRLSVITGSDGYLLKEVDNMPVIEYLATLGVDTNYLSVVTTLPFLVDYRDGTRPTAVTMFSISESGAYCSNEMPVGAYLSFAEVDYDSVLETAEKAVTQALEDVDSNGANGIIAIPCFSRCLMLNPNSEDEMAKTSELIGDKVPFMFIYSGGEFCPVYDDDGKPVNRFHNVTYTLAVF